MSRRCPSLAPARWSLVRTPDGWRVVDGEERPDGLRVSLDARGRARVTLHPRHPYANAGGWQWLSRFVVAEALGRPLRKDEHVHHANGNRLDDRVENYAVMLAEYHGRLHATLTELAGGRGADGRFRERERPGPTFAAPRFGPIIGRAAVPLLRRVSGATLDTGQRLGVG